MHAQVSFDKLRGFFAATSRWRHPSEQSTMKSANVPFKVASYIAIKRSAVAVHLSVDLALLCDKVQTFIFECNSLQNHENCGFAATGRFENS
jgi:hypothetical protein